MKKNSLSKKLAAQNIEGFELSLAPPKPAGNYVAVKMLGNLAYVSGQMPILSSGVVMKRADNITVEFGYEASKLAMANALKQLLFTENIEEIVSVVRVDGFFNNIKGQDLAKMLDGASDLIFSIFSDKDATHARTVFGVNSVPYDAFLELVIIAEVKLI